MKALVKKHSKPGLWMEDISVPEIGPNDLLVKVTTSAICGTDLHIYEWDSWARRTIPLPLTIGHEFVGKIVEVGEEVEGYEVGMRVSGEGHITCGYCRNCRAGRRHLCRNAVGIGINRAGCFSEYLSIPASNAFVPGAYIPEEVAAISDPLGNAVHTAISFDLVGEDVLISGAGPIGLMACAVAKHVGARFVAISDIDGYRLSLARKMGATRTIDAKAEDLHSVMKELGMKEGFDVGLEMSGSPNAFEAMIKGMNHGGRIALLGIPPEKISVDFCDVIFKGLTLKGIYGREMFETWYKMNSMLESGLDISCVITHRFPADSFEEAFELMRSKKCGKVILTWEGKDSAD